MMNDQSEIPHAMSQPQSQRWRILVLLNLFRIALPVLLMLLQAQNPNAMAVVDQQLFLFCLLAYLSLGLLSLISLNLQRPSQVWQGRVQILGDILLLNTLATLSDGLNTAFGAIILLPVSVAGMVLPRREAIAFASFATLGLLGTEVLHQFLLQQPAHYPQAALLGSIAFMAAIGANFLIRRGDESMLLAEQRGVDLEDMARLNAIVIQNIQNGIVVIDGNRNIRLFNAQARQLLSSQPAQPWTGKPIDLIEPQLARAMENWRSGHIEAMPALSTPVLGTEVVPSFTALGSHDKDGTLIFLEDMSLVKRRMQEMKLAALGRLTASIAHEIRNPLSAINHANALLGESPALIGDDKRLSEIIANHVSRINAIIEDILQLSRQPASQPRPMELGGWLTEFMEQYRDEHALSPQDLAYVRPTQAIQVAMDAGHLRQILTNLISNAFMHAKPRIGSVQVRVKVVTSMDDIAYHYLDVMDNGTGIDEHLALKIFEPFFTTSHKGTGLGLFISRELCEFNGARLAYHQDTEVGSYFRISLPAIHHHLSVTEHGTKYRTDSG
jgi:two-component system sensor histidine kinase PilS (NtrC family)